MRQDARVDDRDRGARRRRLQLEVPCGLHIDAADGIGQRPLIGEQRIVRHEDLGEAAEDGVGVLHGRITLQALRDLRERVGAHRGGESQHPDVTDLALGNREGAHPVVQARHQRRPVRRRIAGEAHEELGADVDIGIAVVDGCSRGSLPLDAAARDLRLDPQNRPVRAHRRELRPQCRAVLGCGELEIDGARPRDCRRP